MSSVSKDSSHPSPLQVYSHRQTSHCPSDNSLFVSAISSPPAPTVEPDLPIVIHKGIHSTRNPSPHYLALSYHKLSQPFHTCLSSISFMSIPKTVGDVLAHLGWCKSMLDEISVIQNSGIWELVPLPSGKYIVGYRCVCTLKVGPNSTIDRLKAHLMT